MLASRFHQQNRFFLFELRWRHVCLLRSDGDRLDTSDVKGSNAACRRRWSLLGNTTSAAFPRQRCIARKWHFSAEYGGGSTSLKENYHEETRHAVSRPRI